MKGWLCGLLLTLACLCQGRIHHLNLQHEQRTYFIVSSFGLLKDGRVTFTISNLKIRGIVQALGFSIHRSSAESTEYNLNQGQYGKCILTSDEADLDENTLRVPINVSSGVLERSIDVLDWLTLEFEDNTPEDQQHKAALRVVNEKGEDIYTIAFHICSMTVPDIDIDISLVEANPGPEFLGAGKSALPTVYTVMAVIFSVAMCAWIYVLWDNRKSPYFYKIHYIMLLLIFFKTLSVIFHAVDYHFISTHGTPDEGWAITFYVINFAKGMLLFLTVLLVGAGYGFIKHVLASYEKKLFLVVLSLQLLANVATIVMEQSSQGSKERATWQSIGLLVDLLCCAAILFPVVWSIKHLRDAAGSDGKAALSLRKLQLFRRFYVMVLLYIYVTRIIVYLLETTLPFRVLWISALFSELATLAFYLTTGYMFSPYPDNSYIQLSQFEEDVDTMELGNMAHVQDDSGEGLHQTSAGTARSRQAAASVRERMETYERALREAQEEADDMVPGEEFFTEPSDVNRLLVSGETEF